MLLPSAYRTYFSPRLQKIKNKKKFQFLVLVANVGEQQSQKIDQIFRFFDNRKNALFSSTYFSPRKSGCSRACERREMSFCRVNPPPLQVNIRLFDAGAFDLRKNSGWFPYLVPIDNQVWAWNLCLVPIDNKVWAWNRFQNPLPNWNRIWLHDQWIQNPVHLQVNKMGNSQGSFVY